MFSNRISFAQDQGQLTLPAGRICVFGARSDDELSGLGDVQVVQGLRPDVEALQARGVDVETAPKGDFTAAFVVMPRAKDQARDLVAQAVALVGDGPVWIDGQKTDGVESMLRELRKRATVAPVISKAHGKLFCLTGAELSDWLAQPTTLPNGMITTPGVFSADGVDKGSALLASVLPDDMKGSVIDLGAGWGYLSIELAKRDGITALHLVESDHGALSCARRNVTDPRAQFHWADATTFALKGGADHVVMNPPFHTIRAADPSLGRAFITAAARLLKPHGQLWLVANRHLPYEAALAERFIKTTPLSDHPAFKVILAERPRRKAV